MSAQDFLVELGTEELPPKALATLGDAFLAGIEKGLQAAGLNYTGKQVYAAPRRLAVLIRQLDVQQPDRSINIDGPPLQAAFKDGEPTRLLLLCQEMRCRSVGNRSERRQAALLPAYPGQVHRRPAANHRRRFAQRPADSQAHALGGQP